MSTIEKKKYEKLLLMYVEILRNNRNLRKDASLKYLHMNLNLSCITKIAVRQQIIVEVNHVITVKKIKRIGQ